MTCHDTLIRMLTGRFGIGFNSCYHLTGEALRKACLLLSAIMTKVLTCLFAIAIAVQHILFAPLGFPPEMPTFLSRSYLVMFDPQAKFLPDVNPANPGKRIDILSQTVQEHYQDQIAPYAAFGSDLKREFKGTLFRLPLRTAEQAATSRLSTKVHSTDDLLDMLGAFLEEAQQSLLFLKNVAHIEVLHWQAWEEAPQCLWTCKIANPSKSLSEARALVPNAVAKFQKTALLEKKLGFKHTESDYDLEVLVSRHGRCAAGLEGQVVNRWAVSVTCGDAKSDAGTIACNPDNYHLKLVPWVGVASPTLGAPGAPLPNIRGRAFCFLPLPAETGLPVHVNGYFELSSNRRDIWRGDDLAGEGRTRAQWNKALLQGVSLVYRSCAVLIFACLC